MVKSVVQMLLGTIYLCFVADELEANSQLAPCVIISKQGFLDINVELTTNLQWNDLIFLLFRIRRFNI